MNERSRAILLSHLEGARCAVDNLSAARENLLGELDRNSTLLRQAEETAAELEADLGGNVPRSKRLDVGASVSPTVRQRF